MVYIDIKDMSQDLFKEFWDFLRVKMHVPIQKASELYHNGNPDGMRMVCYSGFFQTETADKIEVWLKEKGIELKSLEAG